MEASGWKYDGEKVVWTLLPMKALNEAAKVLMFGAKKYAPQSWRTVEMERYINALYRHLFALYQGEETDPETGLHHIHHVVCCALFAAEFVVEGQAVSFDGEPWRFLGEDAPRGKALLEKIRKEAQEDSA
jgi:hypothetical protein